MKALTISTIFLLLCLVPWVMYDSYAGDKIETGRDIIEYVIIPAVVAEDWEKTNTVFEDLYSKWTDYKKYAFLFIDKEMLGDLDETFAKCEYYILAKDVSNTSGELACLREMLEYLRAADQVTIQSIL